MLGKGFLFETMSSTIGSKMQFSFGYAYNSAEAFHNRKMIYEGRVARPRIFYLGKGNARSPRVSHSLKLAHTHVYSGNGQDAGWCIINRTKRGNGKKGEAK